MRDWLTRSETAERLGVSRQRVTQLIRDGALPNATRDRYQQWRVPVLDVEAHEARRAARRERSERDELELADRQIRGRRERRRRAADRARQLELARERRRTMTADEKLDELLAWKDELELRRPA